MPVKWKAQTQESNQQERWEIKFWHCIKSEKELWHSKEHPSMHFNVSKFIIKTGTVRKLLQSSLVKAAFTWTGLSVKKVPRITLTIVRKLQWYSENFTELYTCLPSLTLGPLWCTSFGTVHSWWAVIISTEMNLYRIQHTRKHLIPSFCSCHFDGNSVLITEKEWQLKKRTVFWIVLCSQMLKKKSSLTVVLQVWQSQNRDFSEMANHLSLLPTRQSKAGGWDWSSV